MPIRLFRRKITSTEKEEEEENRPPEPVRGIKRLITRFQLFFPLGIYQRGMKLNLKDDSNVSKEEKIIYVQEKSFHERLSYFFSRVILQSLGFSILFTAPISLPWFFLVVIPFSVNLLPFGLANLVIQLIEEIVKQLKGLEWIASVVKGISSVFGNTNPFFLYGTVLWFLSIFDVIDLDSYYDTGNYESLSMIELLASNYQSKLAGLEQVIVPVLIFLSLVVSFFLLVRQAKLILFELQSDEENLKNVKRIKRTILSYYIDENYSQIEYLKDRVTNSPKLLWINRLVKYGPILSVIIPVLLALIIIVI